MTQFVEQANNHHPAVKFTAEISENQTSFLHIISHVWKWRLMWGCTSRLLKHFKIYKCTLYTSYQCHPLGVRKCFIKSFFLDLGQFFKQDSRDFKVCLIEKGFSPILANQTLSEICFEKRLALCRIVYGRLKSPSKLGRIIFNFRKLQRYL